MTGKQFLNSIANGEIDILQILIDLLNELGTEYCIIGGLAVNAYVEPVVSLDLDLIIAVQDIDKVCKAAAERGLKIEQFEYSVNLTSPKSDLRVQIQKDPRYQAFIRGAQSKPVLGYQLRVAAPQDVIKGKIWAYSDERRRKSKRQKDLADILRLLEAFPELEIHLTDSLRKAIFSDS
jgi:hypothetical protein